MTTFGSPDEPKLRLGRFPTWLFRTVSEKLHARSTTKLLVQIQVVGASQLSQSGENYAAFWSIKGGHVNLPEDTSQSAQRKTLDRTQLQYS
jgi:hypothetical protein